MDIEQWFWGIPIVTRLVITSALLLSAAVTFDIVTPLNLIYSSSLVWKEGQYWRIITSLLFYDRINFNCFFNLHTLYMFCRRQEEHFYLRDAFQFLFLLVRVGAALLFFSSSPLSSGQFFLALMYLWCKRFPEEQLAIFFIVTVRAPYLPLVMVVMSLANSEDMMRTLKEDTIGLFVAHFFWYISDVFPMISGFDPLKLPRFVRAMVGAQ